MADQPDRWLIADDEFTDRLREVIGGCVDSNSLEAAYAVEAMPEMQAVRRLVAAATEVATAPDVISQVQALSFLDAAVNDLPWTVREWATTPDPGAS